MVVKRKHALKMKITALKGMSWHCSVLRNCLKLEYVRGLFLSLKMKFKQIKLLSYENCENSIERTSW